MYTITMEKQCGCFKRSNLAASQSFESKDDALVEAQNMANKMNTEFCKKHNFNVVEDGENLIITLAMNS